MLNRRQFLISSGTMIPLNFSTIFLPSVEAQQSVGKTSNRFLKSNVISVTGKCYMNGKPIRKTNQIAVNSRFIIPANSELLFEIWDGSTFRLQENTQLTYQAGKNFSAELTLDKGKITAVIPPTVQRPYIIATKLISFQLMRKSVCYLQTIADIDSFTDQNKKAIQIKEKFDYYLCLCNGDMQILSNFDKRAVWVADAQYHKSFFIKNLDKKVQVYNTKQYNHINEELANQILSGSKHSYPTDWLEQ